MKYMLALSFQSTALPSNDQTKDAEWYPEIIEIGAVLFDLHKCRTVDTFQHYVRPTRFPVLSGAYQREFSIKQHMIDGQPRLEAVLGALDQWINRLQERYDFKLVQSASMYGSRNSVAICTWSDIGLRIILRREGRRKHFQYPVYLKCWIDVQKVVKEYCRSSPLNLYKAARFLNAGTVGTAHSAMDVAYTLTMVTQRLWLDKIRNYRMSCL